MFADAWVQASDLNLTPRALWWHRSCVPATVGEESEEEMAPRFDRFLSVHHIPTATNPEKNSVPAIKGIIKENK